MYRILITGAAGKIGAVIRAGLRGHYPVLRLSHRSIESLGKAGTGEELNAADLSDFDQVNAAMEGVDAVVHMGGKAQEGDWETVHASNIVGTYNVFETARRNGVSRVIFASSNHVIGYYRRTQRIGPNVPPRPDSRYGVSKAFGEALGRLYADKYGLSVICLRIGQFRLKPQTLRTLSAWLSPRDTVQLVRRCIDAPNIHFEVVYGVSANDRNWWDNPAAERIGYKPEDNAEDYAEELLAEQSPEDEPEIERLFHGGHYCGLEFSGDTSKID